MSEFIRKKCKQLEKNLILFVEQQSKINAEPKEVVEKTSEKLVQMQSSVRKLLSQSAPKLIQNYPAVLSEVEDYDKLHEKAMLVDEERVSACSLDLFSQKFDLFCTGLKKVIETFPKDEAVGAVAARDGHIYHVSNINSSEVKISCCSLNGDENDLESKSYVYKTTYSVFATHVFPVRKNVLVLFSDRSARLYGKSYDYYPTPCRYPDHEFFLWPYFYYDHDLHWSFWDPTRSSVCFTHNKRFGFNCLECPKIKMSSSKELFCFIQESEMKIIVVTIYPEKTFEIDKSVHELDTIDCISQGEHTTQILLWSVHEKSVSVLEPNGSKGIGQFSCVQRTLWQNELDLFKLEITCNDKKETAGSLLLAVEKTDSEDKFVREYIFAFAHTFDDGYDDEDDDVDDDDD